MGVCACVQQGWWLIIARSNNSDWVRIPDDYTAECKMCSYPACASFLQTGCEITPSLSTAISIIQRCYWLMRTVFMLVADLSQWLPKMRRSLFLPICCNWVEPLSCWYRCNDVFYGSHMWFALLRKKNTDECGIKGKTDVHNRCLGTVLGHYELLKQVNDPWHRLMALEGPVYHTHHRLSIWIRNGDCKGQSIWFISF